MMNKDCIFCKIVNGEIPKEFVYESEGIVAFDDISPSAKIDVLIIPKKHIESVNEIDDEDKELMGEMFLAVKEIVKKIGINDTGYRLIVNNGENADQQVKHLHIHILGGEDLGPKLIAK